MRKSVSALLGVAGIIAIVFASGCNSVDAPAARSVAFAASFSHSGIRNGCDSCHAKDRPAGAVGNPAYDHSFGGMGDCVSCHAAGIGTTWSGARYSHSPVPSTCVGCHSGQVPTGVVNEMTHGHAGLPDCAACHQANLGTSWTGGYYSHDPVPTTCQDCHGQQRPVGPTGKPSYDHADGGQGDCVSCHTKTIGTSWSGGVAYSHNPAPATCIGCHVKQRPSGPTGTPSFDHANGGQGDCVSCHTKSIGVSWAGGSFSHTPAPASCAGCHSSATPAGVVKEMAHAHANVGDCAGCHQSNLGTSWTGGTFLHQPSLATCQDCHDSQRPVGAVGSPSFDHANGGTGDCVSCHTRSVGTSWKGGLFNHSPTPASCAGCHAAERPVGPVGSPSFDHANGGGGDCASCHTQNVGTSWKGGLFSHQPAPATCVGCHSAETPAGVVKEMAHAHVGLGDCASCHQKNLGTSWNGGAYSHQPTPTTCQDCHAAQRPVGLVGSPAFDHASGGTGDCVSCHKSNIGASWSGGLISHSPVPSSCNSCHQGERPATSQYPDSVGTVQGHYGTTDCYSCHLPQAGAVTTFTFSHVNAAGQGLSSCLPCHQALGTRAHGSGVKDCVSCHTGTTVWSD